MSPGLAQFILFLLSIYHPPARHLLQPQGVHLSWTERPGELAVLWTSWLPVLNPTVKLTATECESIPQAAGFVEFPVATRLFRKHAEVDIVVVTLYIGLVDGVDSNCKYRYVVGQGPHMWSRDYYVKGITTNTLAIQDTNRSVSLAVFGDMGIGNYSIPTRTHLEALVTSDAVHGVLHLGDIAYDMYRHMGSVADEFFKEIEPIAASVPYMVTPGNHEHYQNFSHFRELFRMPENEQNQGSNFFYSFDLGPAHFLSINSEAYFYLGRESIDLQNRWIIQDLKAANQRREAVPWIVVIMHKPLYCQIDWRKSLAEVPEFLCNYDCDHEAKIVRGELEDLLYSSGVDLVFAGHMHNYEREAPLFHNQTVPSAVDSLHYHKNPKAPISILSGSAGSDHVRAR